MTDVRAWTAAELRTLGMAVGVNRNEEILRIDCRAQPARVDSAFFTRLRGLGRLRELHLGGAGLSDEGVAALLTIASLRTLNLEATPLATAQLELLAGLPQLELLVVRGCGCDPSRLAELRRQRIRVRIVS